MPLSSNLDRSRLPLRDQSRVVAVFHASLPIGFCFGHTLGILEQIQRGRGEYLGSVDNPFLAHRRANAGNILPTVTWSIGNQTTGVDSAGWYVPTDVADVG